MIDEIIFNIIKFFKLRIHNFKKLRTDLEQSIIMIYLF